MTRFLKTAPWKMNCRNKHFRAGYMKRVRLSKCMAYVFKVWQFKHTECKLF